MYEENQHYYIAHLQGSSSCNSLYTHIVKVGLSDMYKSQIVHNTHMPEP